MSDSSSQASVITRQLSSARFTVTSEGKAPSRLGLGLLLIVGLCLAAAWFLPGMPGAAAAPQLQEQLTSAQADGKRLEAELVQLRLELGHEKAMRTALEKELATQSEALKQANKNLSFYRNHTKNGSPDGAQ